MTLTIFGKRWFDRSAGNTYHSAAVYDGRELVGRVDFAYGYDDQYRMTAFSIVLRERPGLYSSEEGPQGGYKDYRRFQQENLFIVADVGRRKDL